MKRHAWFPALMLVVSMVTGSAPASAGPDPAEILKEMDLVLRGTSHEMTAVMDIVTKSWKRHYKFKVTMQGVDRTMARVLEPAKVEGQGFLRIGTKLWNYIPTAEKTILIPPSMMLDKFIGSDFSNDDFVKMSYLPRDYSAKLLGRELLNGEEAYNLELTPKKDAPVTYGKLKVAVRLTDAMPMRIEFYNERLEPIRTLLYTEPKNFNGHVIPSVWHMMDHREKGRETTLTVLDAVYNKPVDEKVFDQKNLEKYP